MDKISRAADFRNSSFNFIKFHILLPGFHSCFIRNRYDSQVRSEGPPQCRDALAALGRSIGSVFPHDFSITLWLFNVPSGKLTVHYGKSPFWIGKSTINSISMAIFNSFLYVFQRVTH